MLDLCANVRSEDGFMESVPSFLIYLCFGVELRSPGLCDKCFYPWVESLVATKCLTMSNKKTGGGVK